MQSTNLTPEYLFEAANRCRATAETAIRPADKQTFLEIADRYESIARDMMPLANWLQEGSPKRP